DQSPTIRRSTNSSISYRFRLNIEHSRRGRSGWHAMQRDGFKSTRCADWETSTRSLRNTRSTRDTRTRTYPLPPPLLPPFSLSPVPRLDTRSCMRSSCSRSPPLLLALLPRVDTRSCTHSSPLRRRIGPPRLHRAVSGATQKPNGTYVDTAAVSSARRRVSMVPLHIGVSSAPQKRLTSYSLRPPPPYPRPRIERRREGVHAHAFPPPALTSRQISHARRHGQREQYAPLLRSPGGCAERKQRATKDKWHAYQLPHCALLPPTAHEFSAAGYRYARRPLPF
ncbi:hypothetical protein DFH09DRAFT_1428268, partial [Mycena vulgaris]